ncbi:MAG: hypothetical protein VB140_02650 [Burkholderia sp.]
MPNYTLVFLEVQTLGVELPIFHDSELIYLLVDSTSLERLSVAQVNGKVRQRSYSKRRTERKVFLTLKVNAGFALMTHWDVVDVDALAKLLDQIPCADRIDVIGALVPMTPRHAVQPLLRAVPFFRFRHTRVLILFK